MKGPHKVLLSKLGTLKKGGAILREKLRPEGAAVVLYGDIYTKYAEIVTNLVSRVDPSAVVDGVRLNDGDIVFAGSGETAEEIGKCIAYVGKEEAYAGGDVVILSNHGQDARYLGYALNAEDAIRQKMRLGQGSSVMHLYKDDVGSIVIPLPPLAEQRKIAEILRTWDEAIEAAEAELKAKHERKQWLIAKVLTSSSNEAGAVGAKKMPTERLGKLCDICTGKKDANEGSPDGVYPFFTCAERHGFSESYSFDTEAILVAGNANIGRTNYYKGKFEAYQRTYVLMGFRGVDVPYLYSLLSAKLELDLKNQAQRSAMSYIRLPMLEDYQIPLPPLAEQRKIAEILKCADMDIGSVDKYLESLRAQKRGLMQKLLTGEVRVAA